MKNKEQVTPAITFDDPKKVMEELRKEQEKKVTPAITFDDPKKVMEELRKEQEKKVTPAIIFDAPKKIMNDHRKEQKKATERIISEKSKKVRQRQSLDNKKLKERKVLNKEREASKSVSFVAWERDQFGNIKEIEVDNPDLAGCILPTAMGGVKGFEKLLTTMSEKGEKPNIISSIIKGLSEEQKKDEEEKAEVLANYELKPLALYEYVDRKGKTNDEETEVLLEVLIGEQKQIRKQLKIKCKELNKITQIISKKFARAILYDKKEMARSQIENALREQLGGINTVFCYKDAGWQKIRNKYIYLNKSIEKNGIEVMTDLNLPYDRGYTPNSILEIWEKATSIYLNHDVSSVMVTYAFLGVAYKVFDEAGYPPHFLLFLTGKTGSMKTTISKILYTQLTRDDDRDHPRRIDADTPTSLERALVSSGIDTITLFDDYAPHKTRQKMNIMKDNLETIIRMVGDGSTKSRSNANLEDRRGEGVKGMVAITGELKGDGLSSNLRCLFCEIDKKYVDVETVTWFQHQKKAFNTLIFHFTNFLGQKWWQVKTYIQTEFDPLRKQAGKHLRERRLIDTLVTLWIMDVIIQYFLESYCGANERQIGRQIKNMQSGVEEVVVRSELLSGEQNVGKLFMETVLMMKSTSKLKIKEGRFELMDLQLYDGYIEDKYIYFLPDNLFQKVDSWLRKGKMDFSLNMRETEKLLVKEGYVQTSPNGHSARTKYTRVYIMQKGRVNFLRFPIDVFDEFE